MNPDPLESLLDAPQMFRKNVYHLRGAVHGLQFVIERKGPSPPGGADRKEIHSIRSMSGTRYTPYLPAHPLASRPDLINDEDTT